MKRADLERIVREQLAAYQNDRECGEDVSREVARDAARAAALAVLGEVHDLVRELRDVDGNTITLTTFVQGLDDLGRGLGTP